MDRQKNLAKWHEDSHPLTKNEDGTPRVFYHGTAGDFNAFDNKKTGANDLGLWGKGHYSSAFIKSANSYAERQGHGANVMPIYVSMKNPMILKTGKDLITRMPDGTNFKNLVGQNLDGSKIKAIAEANGHDGVIQILPNGSVGDLVSYNGSQIKSATGNNGNFDPSNPDITKSEGGGITAYHGSPHDFEKFDTSKIGTGEGAQAYGHGLYFAESEPVAKGYRNRVTNQQAANPDFYKGMEFPPYPSRDELNELATLGMKMKQEGNLPSHEMARWKEIKNVQDQYDKAVQAAKPKGHMYEVHIDAHPDHFLDWDKPLSEQSEHVQNVMAPRLEKFRKLGANFNHDPSGAELYRAAHPTVQLDEDIDWNKGLAEQASQFLHNNGIHGIKYLDAGSRGATDQPTRNYVVFDHNRVNVKRKYAKGGSVRRPYKKGGKVEGAIWHERDAFADGGDPLQQMSDWSDQFGGEEIQSPFGATPQGQPTHLGGQQQFLEQMGVHGEPNNEPIQHAEAPVHHEETPDAFIPAKHEWDFPQVYKDVMSPAPEMAWTKGMTPREQAPSEPLQVGVQKSVPRLSIREQFNNAFADAAKKGLKEFTWTNPKTGKSDIYPVKYEKSGGRTLNSQIVQQALSKARATLPAHSYPLTGNATGRRR